MNEDGIPTTADMEKVRVDRKTFEMATRWQKESA